jgi:sulfate adenylyltransferase large subunit
MISSARHESSDRFAAFLEQLQSTELLRFTTAGSVDDGKSTLIGRLLHDSKAVYEDQLAAVKKSRINRSSGPVDFSLITDGLRAEREQGITIDVAYRYFATPRRKFIIADTPGHEQYTRNMATGASTADLAVILVDATKGLLPQTRRHAFLSSLLGITKVIAAVNKMDLAAYREDVFLRLQDDFLALAEHLGFANVQCVPVSGLEGDNVVDRSSRMPWYHGPTLLEHLETVPLPERDLPEAFRLPVQMVIRPDAGFRGFAGRIAGGVVRPGDTVVALPSGQKSRVRAIVSYDGELPAASSPMSVTLQLEDEIDLSRGDMLVSAGELPAVSRRFCASVVWLHSAPLEIGRTYIVKHTVRQTKARAIRIRHRININTLQQEPAERLQMNEIGAVEFESHLPLFFDPYSINRATGSFILIDPVTNATVGAGMIPADVSAAQAAQDSPEGQTQLGSLDRGQSRVPNSERHARHGHLPGLFLFEAQSSLAARVERLLFDAGYEVLHLSGPDLWGDSLAEVLRVTQAAGIIVLYSGRALSGETIRGFVSQFAPGFFDLTATPELHGSEEKFTEHILELARSLRLAAPPSGPGKVN